MTAPLLLLHGIAEDSRSWLEIADLLSAHHHAVAIDLRGHGKSNGDGPYSLETLTADVVDAMRQMGVPRAHFIGHSIGAIVATAVAAQGGALSVINVDQGMRLGDFVPLLAPLRGPLLHSFRLTFASVLDALATGTPEEVRRKISASYATANEDVILALWEPFFAGDSEALNAMAASLLGAVRVPWLAIHGSEVSDDYRGWLRVQNPHALVEEWLGYGHWLHRVDPERFVRRVEDFLRGHP